MTLNEFISFFMKLWNPGKLEYAQFVPWNGQLDLIEWLDEKYESWIPKARQLGISEIAACRICKTMLQYPGSQGIVISKTEPDAEYFLKHRVLAKLRNLPTIPGVVWPTIVVDNKDKLELSNGSVLWSKPASNGAGASNTLNYIVFDEAGGIDKQPNADFATMYKNAMPTIEKAARYGVAGLTSWAMVIGTSEPGTFYNETIRKMHNGKIDADYYFLSWKTDPSRDAEWAIKTKSKLERESDFFNQYPANMEDFFANREGLVFPTFDQRLDGKHINVDDAPLHAQMTIGYDHGFKDDAVMIAAYYDQYEDHLYVKQETRWRQIDAGEIASDYKKIRANFKRPVKFEVADTSIHNRTGVRSVASFFKEKGVRWQKAHKHDKTGSISMLNHRFAKNKITIDNSCRDLIEELCAYSWNPRTNGEKPQDGKDHGIDALLYICAHLVKGERAREPEPEAPTSRFRGNIYNLARSVLGNGNFASKNEHSWQAS